ncbi:MAG: penicillin-binding protein 2 [Victivallaceae bacterium]
MLTSNDAIKVRVKVVALISLLVFGFLAITLYNVQIARHEELYRKARHQYTTQTTTTGKRGEIFDIKGNMLVGNIPCEDIVVDPQIVGDAASCQKIATMFAKYLKLDYKEVYERLMTKTRTVKSKDDSEEERKIRYAVIAKQVSLEDARKLKQIVKVNRFKGIVFKETYMRYYPKNRLLANILGFTSLDHDRERAIIGVEKFFNKQIASSSSVKRYERSRDGKPLSYGFSEEEKARAGYNIYLTISEPIQSILEEELDKLMVKWRPRAAYAVLVDPKTGNILAIAQRPSFNPNERSNIHPDAWRIRITEDVFDPGSSMKPVAIGGALDYGVVTPTSRFDCENGHWFYAGKILRDAHPMQILTVSEIVQKSSNIGTAKIALQMGPARLNRVLRKFGFGSRTGIPLKPETKGLFRPLNRWDSLSITRFPIGQGIGVSPVQLVRAYCALADHGRLRKLRLWDRVADPESGIVINNPIEAPEQLFHRADTWDKIVDMMALVTEEGGTAIHAGIPGYRVAGKTGTSQKFVNGAYSHSQFFATFIGFVPAKDPALVLLVTADEPKGGHYGGTVAAPTFREIAVRTLRYMDIKPDPVLLEAASKKKGKKVEYDIRD